MALSTGDTKRPRIALFKKKIIKSLRAYTTLIKILVRELPNENIPLEFQLSSALMTHLFMYFLVLRLSSDYGCNDFNYFSVPSKNSW